LEKGGKFEFGLFRKIAVILGMSDRSRRVKYDSTSRKWAAEAGGLATALIFWHTFFIKKKAYELFGYLWSFPK